MVTKLETILAWHALCLFVITSHLITNFTILIIRILSKLSISLLCECHIKGSWWWSALVQSVTVQKELSTPSRVLTNISSYRGKMLPFNIYKEYVFLSLLTMFGRFFKVNLKVRKTYMSQRQPFQRGKTIKLWHANYSDIYYHLTLRLVEDVRVSRDILYKPIIII